MQGNFKWLGKYNMSKQGKYTASTPVVPFINKMQHAQQ